MKLAREVQEPIRDGLTWEERWAGADAGLIACWERGRELRIERPELVTRAAAGELVVLPWKGGVDSTKTTKKRTKYGTLFYLAMWQGLRLEDLHIDTDIEQSVVCSATKVTVFFTGDSVKYSDA